MPSISGQVVEYWSKKVVVGAVVEAAGRTAVTDSAGRFSLVLPIGIVDLRVIHEDFHAYTTTLNLTREVSYNVGQITLQSVIRAL